MFDSIRKSVASWIHPGKEASRSMNDGPGMLQHGFVNPSLGTLAGPAITSRTALTIAAVWSAVSQIVNTASMLPLFVAERDERGGRKPARDHWAFELLNLRPNCRSTSMRLRQAWIGHACTKGNGYLEIEWDIRGREAIALHLLDPGEYEPVEDQGSVVYRPKHGDAPDIPSSNILHLAMWGWDGVKGYSPVEYHAEGLGVAKAQTVYQAGLFGNGAQTQGHLEMVGRLTPTQKQQEREAWNSMHQGANKAGVLGILSEGTKFVQTSFSPQDAELILGCHFSVEEVCRIWNISPSRLGLPGAPSKSEEDETTSFLTWTIGPWLKAIQEECDLKLLSRAERVSYFITHDLSEIDRGNIATQTSRDQTDIASGVASINEVRTRRGLERIENPYADKHWIPTNNLTALEDMGKSTPPPTTQPAVNQPGEKPPAGLPGRSSGHLSAVRGVMLETIQRMLKVECNALKRAASKERLDLWVEDYYARHSSKLAEALTPSTVPLALAIGREIEPLALARDWTAESRRTLKNLYTTITPDEMPAAIAKLCGNWLETRAAGFAESIGFGVDL
jgi:HK97 family phage portal protein